MVVKIFACWVGLDRQPREEAEFVWYASRFLAADELKYLGETLYSDLWRVCRGSRASVIKLEMPFQEASVRFSLPRPPR